MIVVFFVLMCVDWWWFMLVIGYVCVEWLGGRLWCCLRIVLVFILS